MGSKADRSNSIKKEEEMTAEEKQALQYLSSLPKDGVDEMNARRIAGTPPLHALDEEFQVGERKREEHEVVPGPPLTSEEVRERTNKWILGKQSNATKKEETREIEEEKRKAARKTRWQKQKAQNKKFRRVENGNS